MQTLSYNYSIINNALQEGFSSVFLHKTKQTSRFLDVLQEEGFIRGYNLYSKKNKIEVFLKYYKGSPVINKIIGISSPGRHIFFKLEDLTYWDKDSRHSLLVLSTSRSVISSKKAKELKTGGKVLCIII